MHSADPTKDLAAFDREVTEQMMSSLNSRGQLLADFSRFVFFTQLYWVDDPCNLNCDSAVFNAGVRFSDVSGQYTFRKARFRLTAYFDDIRKAHIDFSGATFECEVTMTNFNSSPVLADARFEKSVSFEGSRFRDGGAFRGALFRDGASFLRAEFGPRELRESGTPAVADFREVTFEKPDRVRFVSVNRRTPAQPFYARFGNCNVQAVMFLDVKWPEASDRLLVQDELDLVQSASKFSGSDDDVYQETKHELVAAVYRRLGTSFEAQRNYDLAESCFVGVWEMKRQDPRLKQWNRFAVNLYRIASSYGTSFMRAFLVLLFLVLVAFPSLYVMPFSAIAPARDATPVDWQAPPKHSHSVTELTFRHFTLVAVERLTSGFERYRRALLLSLDTATFSRSPVYVVHSFYGRAALSLETILVTGEAALFLLAIRRRFRH